MEFQVCSALLREKSDASIPSKKPVMVVFVHGTILPYFRLGLIKNLLRNVPAHVSSEHSIAELFRYEGWYQYQPIADYGLHVLQDQERLSSAVYRRNCLFGKMFEKIWQQAMGSPVVELYAFGWDGSLSAPRRQRAARAFYHSLVRERDEIAAQQGCDPADVDIVILAHSHGGSTSLLLANQFTEQDSLSIEHLILLGTPIQQETEHLVHHKMFNNIWSLYSKGDLVQVLDVVTTEGVSNRQFSPEHRPAKLRECAIELLDDKTGNILLPSHVQLWFYDVQHMKPFFLQARSPVNPYPVALFAPLIVRVLMDGQGAGGAVRLEKKDLKVLVSAKNGKASCAIPYDLLTPFEKHFLMV